MRILDADALLKMINSKKGMIGCTGLRNYINFMAKDDKEIVKRKKGEWKQVWDENEQGLPVIVCVQCNECKHLNLMPTNFCPHCGADMRKEGEENG